MPRSRRPTATASAPLPSLGIGVATLYGKLQPVWGAPAGRPRGAAPGAAARPTGSYSPLVHSCVFVVNLMLANASRCCVGARTPHERCFGATSKQMKATRRPI